METDYTISVLPGSAPWVPRAIEWLGSWELGAVESFPDGRSCLRSPQHGAECIVCDLHLPDMSATQLQQELCASRETASVVLVCEDPSIDDIFLTAKLGGCGVLTEPMDPIKLQRYVRQGLSRSQRLLELVAAHDQLKARFTALTLREHEVFSLLARGLSSKAIGKDLHLAKRTIDFHRSHIFTKLGVDGFGELALLVNTLEHLQSEKLRVLLQARPTEEASGPAIAEARSGEAPSAGWGTAALGRDSLRAEPPGAGIPGFGFDVPPE